MKNDYYVISAKGSSEEEIFQAASLYSNIWREWPWLENNWTTSAIIQEILTVSKKSSAICFFSKLNQELVGFSWGYFVTKKQLIRISGDFRLVYIFGDGEKVFYISELGVKINHRQDGVGADITEKLMESALRLGATKFVLRTDSKAFPARSLYTKLGFIELPVYDKKYKHRTYWLKTV